MEARQLARRLADLLPSRFGDIRREHARRKLGHAERLALTDPRYLAFLDEIVGIHDRARAARVQYETHMMLYQARQTLRVVGARRER